MNANKIKYELKKCYDKISLYGKNRKLVIYYLEEILRLECELEKVICMSERETPSSITIVIEDEKLIEKRFKSDEIDFPDGDVSLIESANKFLNSKVKKHTVHGSIKIFFPRLGELRNVPFSILPNEKSEIKDHIFYFREMLCGEIIHSPYKKTLKEILKTVDCFLLNGYTG